MQSEEPKQTGAAASCIPVPLLPLDPVSAVLLSELPLLALSLPASGVVLLLLDEQATAVVTAHDAANQTITLFMETSLLRP